MICKKLNNVKMTFTNVYIFFFLLLSYELIKFGINIINIITIILIMC